MRVTDGPLSTKILTQYHFSLTDNDLNKLNKSLLVQNYEFEPMQELLNAKYLEQLNALHLKAMESL